MQIKRFFINKLALNVGERHELVKEDYNYIVVVTRARVGDSIIIANNTGYDFLCIIKEITKNTVTIEIKEKLQNNKEAKLNLTVCQALVKGDKFELITQKITELGAAELIPFTSTFTVVKENTNKTERLNKIAEQASAQCGRAKTLKIAEITTLKNLSKLLSNYDLVLLAYEQNKNSLKEVLQNSHSAKSVAIIIGSEGGFSKEEVDYLEKELKNLKTVSLGARILRAETAAIALSAAVMYERGEMS
jgi:16S rRNA (uracil1498-N3)-methyltransferase